MRFNLKLVFISITILFTIACNSDDQKVYKKFDTSNKYQEQGQSLSDSKADGGFGFESIAESQGWTTNLSPNISGDANAVKGDTLRFLADMVFPNTLRAFGKETRSQFNSALESLIYEPLLTFDSETFKLEPALATHWKVESDSLTFLFRIDPRARFSDGKEVTAEDVVATYKILIDEGHGDPNVYTFWSEKFNMPEAKSKYIVRVKAKKTEWRNLYSFSSIMVYPSYYLNKTTGAEYIDAYQFEMMPGSGPYLLNNQRTTQENNGLVVLDRKRDYWAANHYRNTGLYNFDVLEFIFINDENQEVERFFAGDYDTYMVSRAQWWAEKFVAAEYPEIERGLIQRKKFINFLPAGVGGLAFNTLEAPFDDIKVRKAFCHLWDVEKLMDKLFYHEYVRKNSWFPRSKYANPDNPTQDFNPDLALELLKEAGWTKKPGDKLLSKDGEYFEIENFYINTGWDRIFNPLVKDLEEIGIKINLVVLQNPFEKLMDRKFQVQFAGWTGSLLPSPEGMLHSKYSKQLDVTNVTGMANPEIDNLIDDYNTNWSMEERVKILQKIDEIASKEYHWAFGWGAPYGYRCLNWDKFGMPEHGIGYSGNWLSPISYWWIDPIKKNKLIEARKDNSIKIPIENEIVDFYKNLN